MIILRQFIETKENDEVRTYKNPLVYYFYKNRNEFKTLVKLNAHEIHEISRALLQGGYDEHLTKMFSNLSTEAFNEIREKRKLQ